MAVALIVDIIAELIGGGSGVGERILVAENAGPSAYPVMYAYIVVAGLLGVLLAGAFTRGRALRAALARVPALRAGGRSRAGYAERKGLTLVVS